MSANTSKAKRVWFYRQEIREAHTFLSTRKQSTIFLQTEIDFDEVGTGKELHDHARRNDRRDTKLHKCTTVGCENDTHPVEWVRRVRGHDAI